MTLLITGATGTIGGQILPHLIGRGLRIRALVRDRGKARLPEGVEPVQGEMLDVDAMRAALKGVDTLFLLNAVTADEFTQALITLNLAREAGIERIVYFSVLHSDLYVDVPHFAGKHAVERMIERTDLHATILRPAYFMNNDAVLKDVVTGQGIYPMPVGEKGLAMVDVRDIGEIAALELIQRETSAGPLPRQTIEIVGPDVLTGPGIAGIWSDGLGRPIHYVGGDGAQFERTMRSTAPSWVAYDMRTMGERFQTDGMAGEPGAADRLVEMLGRPLRSYRDFVRELVGRD